jgi:hypothetical protein
MSDEQDVIHEALEQFKESQDGSDYNRLAYEEDLRFSRMSEQWPEEVARQRTHDHRPMLTINKLAPLIRQVVNESRQNKPAIKVSPVDSGSDVETADVISGLVKSIERRSRADVAYDTGIDCAASCGFGFWRVGIDYAAPDSFDLEAKIIRIPNPLAVHWDVNSMSFDAADWNYAFVSDMLSEDEFEAKYPDAEKVSFEGDTRDLVNNWLENERIRVAEYFKKEMKEEDVIRLSNGQTYRERDLERLAKASFEAGGIDLGGMLKDGEMVQAFMVMNELEETRRRTSMFPDIRRRIITGSQVLEDDPWPGQYIPICPVWGDEVVIDGRRHFRSMIRDAKGAQQMHNFWRTAATELVALAPRAPFLMQESALPREGAERQKWQNANTQSYPYLLYSDNSNMPSRQPFAGVPGGAVGEAISANQDIQDITGVYPASIGARSNETSGKAILARERQGDVSNFHFIDNLSRAIQYCGQVLVDIIPAIYSAKETIRILGDDQAEKVVRLTQGAGVTEEGEERLYNLAVGRYDVTVDTGPSFATQREEARETLMELMTKVPGSAAVLGDIFLKHMDFQGAEEAAERLERMFAAQMNPGQPGIPPGQPPQGGIPG